MKTIKGTVQKVESLKEGEIKLSISVPREFKHEAMDKLYEEVILVDPKDSGFRVNDLAAIPKVAAWLRNAAEVLDGISGGEGKMSESAEITPDVPEMDEAGQTVSDLTTDKGEGDINPLELKNGAFDLPEDCPERYDALNEACKECAVDCQYGGGK
jgi:hypothetical protein